MWDFSKYIFGGLVLNGCFRAFACAQTGDNSINVFMSFVKKSLVERGTRGKIRASKEIKLLLLLVLHVSTEFQTTSLSYFLVKLIKGWTQRLCQTWDLGAITKK